MLRAGLTAALRLPFEPEGRQDGTYRGGEDGGAALAQGQDPLLKMMPLQPLGQRPQTSFYFGSRTRRAVIPPDGRPVWWKEPGRQRGSRLVPARDAQGIDRDKGLESNAVAGREGASYPRRAMSGSARACPTSRLPTSWWAAATSGLTQRR